MDLHQSEASGLYSKHIIILNDTSRVVSDVTLWNITLGLSITILEASFTLICDVYSTGITHDDCQLMTIICLKYMPQHAQ